MHAILEILDGTDASVDLITLDDLKLALGIEGTNEDAALQAQITFQSRIIAEYCDRRLARAEALETFTFDPGEILPVRQGLTLSLYPLAAVTEVSALGVITTDYEFDPASGRIWATNGYWATWGANKIAVTYSGGFDLPEGADARLQRAVIEAVNMGRQSGTRDPTIAEVQ